MIIRTNRPMTKPAGKTNRSKSIVVAAVALSVLMSAGSTNAAQLRQRITVEGPSVTLGDLFEGAGAASSIIVVDAPAPGRIEEISVSKVAYMARTNGVKWTHRTPATRIAIHRTGKLVPNEILTDALLSSLEEHYLDMPAGATLQIDLTAGTNRLFTAQDVLPSAKVERLSFNERTGRFAAIVKAPADDLNAPHVRVEGKAYRAIEVPVLARQVSAGDAIKVSDINFVRMPVKRIARNMITDQTNLVGMTPRRSIRMNAPVRINEVEMPMVISKNDLVTIHYNVGPMSLASRGRALSDAGMGEVVTLINDRSGQKVQAIVMGPNSARIEPISPLQIGDVNQS
ncbi:MAG: flagellar basal body P-ring formation chaperone FlgA [Parvibaculaceae bacterium]|nr:flagellar basal body P-ring formation chaperone FlgA [Parvibaculaceae bacterium]